MDEKRIRPISICVCRDGDRILVAEGRDSKKNQVFYRPLGGTIEFGERGEETVCRELMEEIGATLTDVRYLGALENIFIYGSLYCQLPLRRPPRPRDRAGL